MMLKKKIHLFKYRFLNYNNVNFKYIVNNNFLYIYNNKQTFKGFFFVMIPVIMSSKYTVLTIFEET